MTEARALLQRPKSTARSIIMGIEVGGLLGLILLIAMVWAIFSIFQSSASTGAKALWTVLIIVLPVLGLIIWFLTGPKGKTRTA
jgi:hypothetical protein